MCLGECDGDDAGDVCSFEEVNGSVLFAEEFCAVVLVLLALASFMGECVLAGVCKRGLTYAACEGTGCYTDFDGETNGEDDLRWGPM